VLIGQRISHYRILERLGAGAMGEVYKAHDLRLGRQVALKFLSQKVSDDPQFRTRFHREARAASALNHPNICTIYDIDQYQGLPFLAMELLSGETLRRRISGSPLPTPQLLALAVQIADALEAAHAKGIVHRDVKSANIFVTQRDEVKVLDFGLAKVLPEPLRGGSATDSDTSTADFPPAVDTSSGAAVGTVAYMSPEQARGEELDARSDLFSFGVVLYEMATGRLPFTGNTIAVVFDAILNKPPQTPFPAHAEVSPDLETLILRALEKRREDRYQSARELYDDLRRVQSALASGQTAVLASVRTAARISQPSIAVLPLLNISGDPDNEYFGDGLAEELINALTKIERLRVVARSSAFQFKGQSQDVREIGRRLGVNTVLEGSVRKSGDRLRVTAQLVNVADGYHLWSDRFDRTMEDVFAIQDEIAETIVAALRVKLMDQEKQRLLKRYTDNVEAYNLYLRGRYHWGQRTYESVSRAIDHFQRAIDIDPGFALAYAGLADCYAYLGGTGEMPRHEAMPKAREAALKATAIDDALAEAHTSLALVDAYYDYNWAEAERHFVRALKLDPDYATARHWYALFVLLPAGRFAEAAREAERARQLDPLTPSVNSALGWVYFFERDYDRAIEVYRRILELAPDHALTNVFLGDAYAAKGMWQEAMEAYQKGSSVQAFAAEGLALVYSQLGKHDEARKLLDELDEMLAKGHAVHCGIARVCVELGENTRAVEHLEQAYADREPGLVWLKVDPAYDKLRPDPRFTALLRRMDLQ